MRGKTFFEGIIAALGFPFELLDGALEILNQRFSFCFFVIDDKLHFGVHLEACSATRTLDFEQTGLGLRHIGIVAHAERGLRRLLSSNCYAH